MSYSKKSLTLTKTEIKIWLFSFALLVICFLPLIFNFIWGNHDWIPLKNGGFLTAGLIEGRFAQYLFLYLFLDSHILPILNTILGFLIYTLSLTLLSTRFFEFSIKSGATIFIIPLIATLPYINEITYFQFIIFSQLIWTFTIFCSLMFAKLSFYTNHIIYTILATLFLFLSIGGYPASANLFVTSFALYLAQNYHQTSNLKNTIQKSLPFILSLVISFSALYVVYIYLQEHNRMLKMYNTATNTPWELLLKLPQTLLISIKSMLTVQPFFSPLFKLLTTIIFFAFIFLYNFRHTSYKDLSIRLLLSISLIIALKFSTLLVKETANTYFSDNDPISFMIRADFYSIPVFLLFSLFFIQTNFPQKITGNLVFISIIILIFSNLNSNLSYSKTQTLGFKAEANLQERILSRIENSPLFTPKNFYNLVLADEISLRHRYYQQSLFEQYGLYTLQTPFSRYWLPHEHYNFYAPYPFVKSGSSINQNDITPNMISFLSTDIKTWPSPNSIYVNHQYAIIAQSNKGKKMLQEQFKLLQRDLP